MDENKKKEEAVEKCLIDGIPSGMLRYIVAKTYARHADLDEKEFLKEIGFENTSCTEEQASLIGIYNVITEASLELFRMKNSVQYTTALLKQLNSK